MLIANGGVNCPRKNRSFSSDVAVVSGEQPQHDEGLTSLNTGQKTDVRYVRLVEFCGECMTQRKWTGLR